jgi:hypothetical protein
MSREIDDFSLTRMQALIERRHEEVVQLIRHLVEIESPSGDAQGSLAVNDLLESAARVIPSVSSVERVAAPDCGEHLLIRAFCEEANGTEATLILGHTDTVHPRGTLAAQRGLRQKATDLWFHLRHEGFLRDRLSAALLDHPGSRPATIRITAPHLRRQRDRSPLIEREARQSARF